MLVIADLSGRTSRGICEPLAGRKPIKVDLDRLDSLPAELGTTVCLQGRGGVTLSLKSIDDLHPDEIYNKCELFAALRDLRKRARDPESFRAVADEVRSWAGVQSPASQIETKPKAVATPESEFASLLSASVGKQPKKEAASIDSLLRQIVGPHIIPDRDPEQSELIEVIELATASEMRAFLHDPDWRTVESAWRSLHTLVTGLELDEELELFALDATPQELTEFAADLEELIVTKPSQTAGGIPWALIINTEIHTPRTLDSLAALTQYAHRAGAVLTAGVSLPAIGIEQTTGTQDPADWGPTADALASLAESPSADALCLAAPGFLLRMPFGQGTDEIERFEFEELKGDPTNHELLWAPGAIAVALMLGNAFKAVGWNIQPIGAGVLDDLPVITTENGEAMHPCAQIWLSDRASSKLATRGITPLVSVQHRGAVQVAGLRAVSGNPLACRWEN